MLTFDKFMHRSLYGRDGFYSNGRGAGRGARDFITSPEVGPLFGTVLANAIEATWRNLGEPEPFAVFDIGCGPNRLLKAVAAAKPEMPWVLTGVDPYSEHADQTNISWLDHCENSYVIANELLDNLPFKIVELGGPGQLLEIAVSQAGPKSVALLQPIEESFNGRDLPGSKPIWDLARHNNPASSNTSNGAARGDAESYPSGHQPGPSAASDTGATSARASSLASEHEPGGDRMPLPLLDRANEWVTSVLERNPAKLLVLDYGVEKTRDLVKRDGGSADWLRAYQNHHRSANPLSDILNSPGSWDITTDIVVDQLPTPAKVSSQATFLQKWGIDDLVAEGKKNWQTHAAAPDLTAIKMRSRVSEAEALVDQTGLGAFLCLEWER